MSNEFFQIPDIFSAKKVLCVQPHPDDMDLSIGGTIKQLTEKGIEVDYLTVTDDAAGFASAETDPSRFARRERADIRKTEQMAAGKILGVNEYFWLDLPDAGEWSHIQARDGIIDVIRSLRPDFLLTVDPTLAYEAHMDHLRTGRAASEAVMLYNFPHVGGKPPAGFIPFDITAIGYVWTNKPNTLIDTTAWNEVKFDAAAKHQSQFPTNQSFEQMKAYLTYRASNDAKTAAFDLGEPLKLLPPIMLHCFPEAELF